MLDYQSLIDIQDQHLAKWRIRLKPEVWTEVYDYAKKHNSESADGKHRVFRGQDLVQIIFDWPALLGCYPAAIPNSEDVL